MPVIRAWRPAGVGAALEPAAGLDPADEDGTTDGDVEATAVGATLGTEVGAIVAATLPAGLATATEARGLDDAVPESIPDAPIATNRTRITAAAAASAGIICRSMDLPTGAGAVSSAAAPAAPAPTATPATSEP